MAEKTKAVKKESTKKTDKKGIKRFRFFRDVYSELKKVTWPSRKMVVTYTIAVLVMSIVMAIILGAWEIGLTQLMNLVIG